MLSGFLKFERKILYFLSLGQICMYFSSQAEKKAVAGRNFKWVCEIRYCQVTIQIMVEVL